MAFFRFPGVAATASEESYAASFKVFLPLTTPECARLHASRCNSRAISATIIGLSLRLCTKHPRVDAKSVFANSPTFHTICHTAVNLTRRHDVPGALFRRNSKAAKGQPGSAGPRRRTYANKAAWERFFSFEDAAVVLTEGVHLRPSAANNEFFSPSQSQGADVQSLMTLYLVWPWIETTPKLPLLLMSAVELPLDFRPELFQDVGSHVDANLHAKFLDRIAGIAIIHVIAIRDSHCD